MSPRIAHSQTFTNVADIEDHAFNRLWFGLFTEICTGRDYLVANVKAMLVTSILLLSSSAAANDPICIFMRGPTYGELCSSRSEVDAISFQSLCWNSL